MAPHCCPLSLPILCHGFRFPACQSFVFCACLALPCTLTSSILPAAACCTLLLPACWLLVSFSWFLLCLLAPRRLLPAVFAGLDCVPQIPNHPCGSVCRCPCTTAPYSGRQELHLDLWDNCFDLESVPALINLKDLPTHQKVVPNLTLSLAWTLVQES